MRPFLPAPRFSYRLPALLAACLIAATSTRCGEEAPPEPQPWDAEAAEEARIDACAATCQEYFADCAAPCAADPGTGVCAPINASCEQECEARADACGIDELLPCRECCHVNAARCAAPYVTEAIACWNTCNATCLSCKNECAAKDWVSCSTIEGGEPFPPSDMSPVNWNECPTASGC